MFSKNIKTLSLFLVLAAVMIVAVGAVSAANTGVAITDNNINVTGTVSNTGSTISGSGSITTNISQTPDSGSEVPKGSALNSTVTKAGTDFDTLSKDTNPTITVDTGIYSDIKGTTTGATISPPTVTTVDNGTYSIDGTIADTNNVLVNGTTYFLKLTVPSGSAAYLPATGDTSYVYTNGSVINYIPFTYTGSSIVLDKNTSTISYGDDWSFSGTLVDSTGKVLAYKDVTVNLNGKDIIVKTDANGKFVFNSSIYNAANDPLDANTETNYTVTFSSTGVTTTTAQLNVTKKTLKIVGSLNATNINFGDFITINGFLYDANGKLMNISTIGTLTGTITPSIATTSNVTLNYNEKTGTYTVADTTSDAVAKELHAGTYYITLAGTNDNYALTDSNVMVLTVNKIATSIKGNDTITTTVGNLGSEATLDATFIKLVSNTTTGKENVSGSWTVIVNDASGTPLEPLEKITVVNGATATITNQMIAKITSNGVYSIDVTFTPTDADNYAVSTTTVNLIVKKLNTITITNEDLTYDFGTTGNDTYLNITSDKVMNTTVEVFLGNKSLGNVDIKDGKASIDFGKLALQSDDYKVTIVYAGDDTYLPFNATTTLTVVGKNIGNLNTNASIINGVTINSVNKTFTLNLTNSTKDLVNYTGKVNYYINGELAGTVNMVEGKVIVDAKTLTGLTNGANFLTFQIKNNFTSGQVMVTINTVQLPTDIIADNLTTTNNTNIIIKGSVTNATEGLVTVILLDKDNETLALAFGVLNADGTFNVSFANYANGVYTANIMYNSTTGLSKNNTKNITVTVNGTAPTPTGNITTNLTINTNFTEAYGEGLNLTGKLTDANGNPIVGQHIALNLTNPTTGASKIYWVTTDTNGEYQLQINLFVGSYTASASYGGFTTADNTTTYLPSGPANGTITVTNGTEPVDNRTATVLSFSNFTEKYGQALNFTGTLKTTDGTPIIGQKVAVVLSNAAGQSRLYWSNTDTNGEIQRPIELFAGNYTFYCYYEGDSTYQPSNNQTGSITVTA